MTLDPKNPKLKANPNLRWTEERKKRVGKKIKQALRKRKNEN